MEFRERSTRREFLQETGLAAAGAVLANSALNVAAAAEAARPPDLVVTHGEDAKALVKKAIEELGGMKRFVAKGDVVVVKPNIGWDRLPRMAANTNPDVVAALIEMAIEAEAKEVKVFDNPINNAQSTYERSGIAEAAKKAGATVKFPDERFFKEMDIKGQSLKTWPVYTEAVECDCLINVPVAKQHSMARLTMAMKNHMGIIGGERGKWHATLDSWLAEFAAFIKPKVKLTVLDAYRILVAHGPTGGSLKDVQMARKCVAGVDQVAVDAYGASFFKLKPTELGYLIKAKEMSVGETDLSKLTIKEVEVA
jgi:uncharacterized protein (DUF362 family)